MISRGSTAGEFDGRDVGRLADLPLTLLDERLPKGVSNAAGRMDVAMLDGQKVIIKRPSHSGAAAIQAAVDELKPLFGLEKMGTLRATSGREPVVILRYRSNLGDLVNRRDFWDVEPILRQLLHVATFEAVVRTGDRTLGNILLLPSGRLLLIDELRAFLPHGNLKAQRPLKDRVTMVADGVWMEWCLELLEARQGFAVVLERFGLEAHAADLCQRVERVVPLTNEILALPARPSRCR